MPREKNDKKVKEKGAKKNNRKNNVDDDDDNDDNGSDDSNNEKGTVFTISNSSDANDMLISVNISEAVEMLLEKRLSQREQALTNLLKLFSCGQSLVNYQETILVQLSRIIRRPSSFTEADLAMKLLTLFSLWLGPDEDDFFNTYDSLLQKLVNNNDIDENIRVVALSALSFCSFINSVEARESTIILCEEIMCSGNNDGNDLLCFTAIKSWILLASIMTLENIIDS